MTISAQFGRISLAALFASTLAITACGNGGAGDANSSADTPDAPSAETREIRVVGSSTVYPFSTKVSQEFKAKTGINVVVESTGSGGGHKLFCEGVGLDTPDITNSSRRQKKSELEMCRENGVDEVIEVKVGFDGIVLANTLSGPNMDMRLKDVFRAFAKELPTSDTDCTMQPNPYTRWSDINPDLPDTRIEAYGPPPTSGTRDAFVEIAMEGGAKTFSCLSEMSKDNKDRFKTLAHTVREDGYWIDSGENDNAIVQTLVNTPTAVGVFGYSFLDQNIDKVKGAKIDGAEPTFENVGTGDYPISRSLYVYLKKAHIGVIPGLQDYALEFLSEEAAGPGGYLENIGLIGLPAEERAKVREAVINLEAYDQ